MATPTSQQQKRWLEQWQYAAANLPRLEYQELRALTNKQLIARIDAVLSMAGHPEYRDHHRRSTSGLVDQQALFRKLREV